MDADRFDHVARALTVAMPRRAAPGLLLGSALGLAGIPGSGARKRKGKGKGKGKGKKQPGGQAPPAPVARADAACIVTGGNAGYGAGGVRIAQTFQAMRTGQLTSATVSLRVSGPGMDFGIEIWSVNAMDVPRVLLGGTTVTEVPATSFPGPRRLTATLPNPVAVVAGTRYAIVVTKGSNADMVVGTGNPCVDGRLLTQGTIGDPFTPLANVDMHFETVVVS